MNSDTNAIDSAFLALLDGLAPGGVWFGVAPEYREDPFIVVSVPTDTSSYTFNGSSTVQTVTYLVRVVADGQQARSRGASVLLAVDEALNFAKPTVAGYVHTLITRQGAGQRYADPDGFYNYAYYYQFFLSQ